MSRRAALDAHLAASSGIVSRDELTSLGFRPGGIDSLVRSRVLVPVFPSVYRSAAWPPGHRTTLTAICRRSPVIAISHTTAGREYRIRAMSDPRLHVLVPYGRSPDLDRIEVHRCRSIGDDDIVERDGLRITSVARTLFDAAGVIGPKRTESALEYSLNDGLVTIEEVAATFARLAIGGRPGAAELGAVLRRRPGGVAAVESGLELRVVQALRAAGFPEPTRQLVVELRSGRSIRIDLAYPQWMIAIEVDHPVWHDRRRVFESDRDRDRQLTAMGWRVLRLTEADLGPRLPSVIADLRTLIPAHTGVLG